MFDAAPSCQEIISDSRVAPVDTIIFMKADLIFEMILLWTINQFIKLQGTRVSIDMVRQYT